MGASLSWLAVKGKPAAEVLRELHLRGTSESGLDGESAFAGAAADNGWYLIVARGAEHDMIAPAVAARLSTGCKVLTCTVEEHVMFSQAAGWENGTRRWLVTHEGENGPVGISEEGTLPPEYAPIRDRLLAEQESNGGANADVDYLFDIPVALVQSFVGYKHDETNPALEERGFEVLEPDGAASSKPSWIRRLFSAEH